MISMKDIRVWAEKHNMYMDFVGQRKAEKLMNLMIVTFFIIAFPVGYYRQQLSDSVLILLVGCILTAIVVLPPWPCYHKNPIVWYTEETKNNKKTN
uniref:Signal peptidase complex subunit 1 n=1 Tax=Schistosoma japonicum TaxID=6182 RepID=C1LNZ1_SCHJA|nr:Microsomal signal peptidase 12 kDa subunit,domain-containing protein [Schistosoma japonicum]